VDRVRPPECLVEYYDRNKAFLQHFVHILPTISHRQTVAEH
jgi:hypothetical protein